MATRKLARFAGAVALLALGGCAAYPYDDPNYRYSDGRYYSYDGTNYYPRYGYPYYGPSVGFGIAYSDTYYYPRHRYYPRYP